MMRKLILLFYIVTIPCWAAQVSGLYQSAVPVQSQNTQDRDQAVAKAFRQVLIKVSGYASVVDVPEIQQAINNAGNYLQAYTYKDQTDAEGNPELLLDVQFDAQAVNHLLKQNRQTFWGNKRPLVLIWLACTDAQGGMEVLNNESREPAVALLKQAANMRGLPIIFPILDLTDMQVWQTDAGSQPDFQTILQASKRYGSDAVFVIAIRQSANGQWQGSWFLSAQGHATTWSNSAADLSALMNAGVNEAADILAARYSVSNDTGDQGHVELTVTNIKDLTDYAKVSNYLKSLAAVKQVDVLQINPGYVVFSLQVAGGKFALQQALSLDRHLQAVDNPGSSDDNVADLTYQWTS